MSLFFVFAFISYIFVFLFLYYNNTDKANRTCELLVNWYAENYQNKKDIEKVKMISWANKQSLNIYGNLFFDTILFKDINKRLNGNYLNEFQNYINSRL